MEKRVGKKITGNGVELVLPGNDGVMPIAGYYGPHAPFTNTKAMYTTPNYVEDKYYQMIEDAGFNFITYTEHDYQKEPQVYHEMLTMAEKHHIKMLINDGRIREDMTDEEFEECIAEYTKYKSFGGFYVTDEPSTTYFPNKLKGFDQTLGRRLMDGFAGNSRLINSYDNLLGYVNLLPIYHWMKSTPEEYENYVKEYCETFDGKMLSYDHYPFCVYYEGKSPEKAMKYYFLNFSIIYKYAKQYNLNIWAFVQAGGNWASGRKEVEAYTPNREETLWLVNISLAYGSKGIQYYPMIQTYGSSLRPDGTIDGERSGIISADCKPTRYWHFAKDANRQIAAVDEVLLDCKCDGMISTGEAATYVEGLPEYFTDGKYRQLLSVESADAGTVIGCFDYNGKTALYVVNNDREKEQSITLNLNNVYTYRLLADGSNEKCEGENCTVTLAAGAAVLIVIE